jgi:hypothetical protein
MRGFVDLVDLGVLTILVAAVVFPPREMNADAAISGTDDERFELALAEANTIAHPDVPIYVEKLSDRLGELGFKDWAIEVAVKGADRTRSSSMHWQALLATSVAYVDRLDAKSALAWAHKAFQACAKAGEAACPTWEKTRIEIYQEHLQAGVDAGIDPRRNPRAFREAGESKIRSTRIGGSHDTEREAPVPAPAPTPSGD